MPYASKETRDAAAKRHYNKHKTRIIARNSATSARSKKVTKEFIDSLKESDPCSDCGKSFPAICMDFHHVSGTKEINISTALSNKWPILRIEAEIKKCVILCACCHRLKHSGMEQSGSSVAS